MNRFDVLARRWNADLRPAYLPEGRSQLDFFPGVARIAFAQWLPPLDRNETIAVQFGHLELQHPCMRYVDALGCHWKGYLDRQAMKWAADYLVPDGVISALLNMVWVS